MNQHSAIEGLANDWHMVNYGKFAQSGAAMVMLETAAIEARGRATYGDLGLWSNDHVAPLGRIATFIRSQGAIAAIQLGHAGRKAGLQRPWEGGGQLSETEAIRGETPWQTLAPSAIPAAPNWPVPSTMSAVQLEEVASAFEAAARRAIRAGFDVLQIDCAHGHLLHQFLSANANLRSDAYGGSADRRRAYPLAILKRVRAIWPADKPLMCSVPTLASVDDGYGMDEAIDFVRELKAIGVDLVECAAPDLLENTGNPQRAGRNMESTLLHAEQFRRNVVIPTMAVNCGGDPARFDAFVSAGRADFIGVTREAVHNPNWPLHARAQLEADAYDGWPRQYSWLLARTGASAENV